MYMYSKQQLANFLKDIGQVNNFLEARDSAFEIHRANSQVSVIRISHVVKRDVAMEDVQQ